VTARINMSEMVPADELRARLDALDKRIAAHQADFPTDRHEVQRLARLALDLSEPSGPAYATTDEADRQEIDRLRALATQLLHGTEPAKDTTPATPADGDDDAAEITRLAKIAKEHR
jgi:hypothetical protein